MLICFHNPPTGPVHPRILRKARELRLLNSREVRRGSLAAGRVDVASKSGQWLLSLEQNQAEVPCPGEFGWG